MQCSYALLNYAEPLRLKSTVSRDSYKIGDTHYRDYYNYGMGLGNNFPKHKRFINYILIDNRNGLKSFPTQKQYDEDK